VRFTEGDRRSIEEAIPDGYRINVQPQNGNPGKWDLLAFGPDPDWNTPLLRVDGRYDPEAAAYAMADRLRVSSWRLDEDLTVTVPLTNRGAA
jgi:hypothetical protein